MGRVSREGNFQTSLACRHVVTTPYMNPGTEIYCLRCQKMTTTISSLKKYTWRCETCLKKRSYIAERLRCEGLAMKHYRQNRDHHVIFYNMDGKILWNSHPTTNIQSPLF